MVMAAAGRGWPYFDPDYETMSATLNPPKVVIDNAAVQDATLIKLDSINRHGILLEVVQVLTDLDLFISKAYVASDGGWFMDVFHVTDSEGKKITDEETLKHLEESLGRKARYETNNSRRIFTSTRESNKNINNSNKPYMSNMIMRKMKRRRRRRAVGIESNEEHTAIEVSCYDRAGLLSEIFSTLAALQLNITSAQLWTHKATVACLIFVQQLPHNGGGPVKDTSKLISIKELLSDIVRSSCDVAEDADVATDVSSDVSSDVDGEVDEEEETNLSGWTHTERRLHQLMSAAQQETSRDDDGGDDDDVDGDGRDDVDGGASSCSIDEVTVKNCVERGYSVVNIRCKDRSKLLFDTVCTLTDMDYMIFHATILSEGPYAYQEFYIRHMDGYTLETQAEREKLTRCLEAAIQRRTSEGLRLELCTGDRAGLLSDVTRVFRQHGLSVTRAYVSTRGSMAFNTFYVTDASGKDLPVDAKVVDAIRQEIGHAMLQVIPSSPHQSHLDTSAQESSIAYSRFSLLSFLKSLLTLLT